MNLQTQTILVTGGTSGLGLSLTKKLSQSAGMTYGIGSKLEKVQRVEKDFGFQKLKFLACDISNYEQIKRLKEEVGKVDILINNAGIWLRDSLIKLDPEKISNLIQVNLTGQILVTQIFLENMLKQNQGLIFNISSTSGIIPKPGQTAYCASKFGLRGFTESLKEELKETNIRVFGFYPSGINTEFFSSAGQDRDTSQFMNPDDLSELIEFIIFNSDKYLVDHLVVNRIN